MKKVNLKSKLSLNKETIANLNNDQLNAVIGGGSRNHMSCSGCNTEFTCPPIGPNPTVGCLTFDPPTITGC